MTGANPFGLIVWATENVGHKFVELIRITEVELNCIYHKS